ncbi:MAG: alpha/beta hydrolase, partial [Pseudomonadota bacterium]
EIASLTSTWLPLLAAVPRGEPHPVFVLPGFLGGDDSTALLRRFLSRLRYKPFPWLQGTNTGNPKQLENVIRRFYRLHHAMDAPITLIGQSLGGVYAREIARTFPDAVRSVITLGSPYGTTDGSSTNPLVERMFERMSGLTIEEMRELRPTATSGDPLPMPTTSVYSTTDGVVGWRTCIEPEDHNSENIRVRGSHAGMAMNPDVLRIIADRLAQNPADWQPFDIRKGCHALIYPNP